jgi:hypothetical protein
LPLQPLTMTATPTTNAIGARRRVRALFMVSPSEKC